MDKVVVHAPYIINLGNTIKPETRELGHHSYVKKLKDVMKLVLQDLFFIQVLMLKQGTKQD